MGLRKLIALLVLVAIAFLVYNRQRLFVRDPLGSVTRDGVKERGAQVFINYSNDVLLENDNAPMYVTLVQRGQPVGTPAKLGCIHYVVCMTDANVGTLIAADPRAGVKSMSSKAVEYSDASGRDVVVKLR
jgi:hypothetical protein